MGTTLFYDVVCFNDEVRDALPGRHINQAGKIVIKKALPF